MFKCNLALLRLTTTLTLFALPPVLTRLLAFHQRRRPPSILAPSIEALVLSTFPIAWFFGFLYYTEVPSLVSVLCTVVIATQNKHWLAGLVGGFACSPFLLLRMHAYNYRGAIARNSELLLPPK